MKIPSINIFRSNKIQLHELDDKTRDKNILRQIFSSLSFKVISVGLGFVLVPVILKKLGSENYGIWAILLSLMQWVALMDVGIGNGLRNKLSQSLSVNNKIEAREYVSTAYYAMAAFGILLVIILFPVFFIVDWNRFFNSGSTSKPELMLTIMIFIYSMVAYFVLSLINQVINAVQRNALTSIAPILANLVFIAFLMFNPAEKVGLMHTTIAYSFCFLGSIACITWFFFREYRYLVPTFSFFKKSKIKAILDLGIKFFIIQIVCIIIFSTDNIIITQLFGPKAVSNYSIPFMIFTNIGIILNMVMMPFYSSYTEAYAKNNLQWIQSKVILLCKLMIPFIIGLGVVVWLFPYIIHLWVGDKLDIPKLLPLLMGLYTIVTVWNNIFAYVLNGIGKINLGMYLAIATGLINIPLSILLAKNFGWGLNGIIVGNTISLSISSFIAPVQVYYFIFSKRRSEKWDRFLG